MVRGVDVDGERLKAASVSIGAAPIAHPGEETPEAGAWLVVVLHQGRNREIRRMLGALGIEVIALRRIRLGSLHLGELGVGAFRELTTAEVDALYRNGKQAEGKATTLGPLTGKRATPDSKPSRQSEHITAAGRQTVGRLQPKPPLQKAPRRVTRDGGASGRQQPGGEERRRTGRPAPTMRRGPRDRSGAQSEQPDERRHRAPGQAAFRSARGATDSRRDESRGFRPDRQRAEGPRREGFGPRHEGRPAAPRRGPSGPPDARRTGMDSSGRPRNADRRNEGDPAHHAGSSSGGQARNVGRQSPAPTGRPTPQRRDDAQHDKPRRPSPRRPRGQNAERQDGTRPRIAPKASSDPDRTWRRNSG